MEPERLYLQVNATSVGWSEVRPAVLRGHSGIDHHFAFLAQKDQAVCSFDIYDRVTEIEVLRTFTKKIDTGVPVTIVSISGWSEQTAQNLARSYGIEIIGTNDIPKFFERSFPAMVKEQQGFPRTTGL